MATMESVRQSPAMDIMATMGRDLLNLAMATMGKGLPSRDMVTMESVRQSPAMDIMATMGRDLLSLAMATMENVKQSPALDIMAMDFHTTEAMWCMDRPDWRLAI